MPRTAIYTRNQIAKKTLHLIKERGPAAFTARDVGTALGTSSRPIFTAFENMEDLRNEVFRLACRNYDRFMDFDDPNNLNYEDYLVKLIRYAEKEPNLFQFCLTVIGNQSPRFTDPNAQKCIEDVRSRFNLSEEKLEQLIKTTWIFTIGIAMQCAIARFEYSDEEIKKMFSDNIESFAKKNA